MARDSYPSGKCAARGGGGRGGFRRRRPLCFAGGYRGGYGYHRYGVGAAAVGVGAAIGAPLRPAHCGYYPS
jgi:hypothetical protein